MNKRVFMVAACIVLFSTGCSMLNPFVKDIKGWDLTACVGKDEFKVCKELFMDNRDKIFGGQKTVDSVVGMLQVETMAVESEDHEGT